MRRAAILLLLLGGLMLILPLGAAEARLQSQSLLIFGFLILAAYTIAEIVAAVGLPKIVGYLFAGVLFGPSLLGTVSPAVIDELSPVNRLAIALIAFLAGAELRLSEVRAMGGTIMRIMTAELTLQFAAIVGLLMALRQWIPFLDGPLAEALTLSALFAAVAIVHSPAVTLALLTETGARGPVARTTLGIVLVADVVVVLLFSGTLAAARALAPPPSGGAGGVGLGFLAWEIGGALLVGALLGGAIALYLRFVQRELVMFAVVVTFFGAEIARLAHVETLLTLLVAGFITENATKGAGEALRHAMERSAAPVFVVFFALAGAQMGLREVAALWPVVLPLVGVRMLALWGGSYLGARWAGTGAAERRYVWLGLVSQAGVAIGLASVVAAAYPERGAQMRTLFLAVMAINQVLGPILFRLALARSGELPEEQRAREPVAAH